MRLIWPRDLNCHIDEDTWKQIVADNGTYIKETRGKFTQLKILHWYYWTPYRLFKVGLISTNTRWNCKTEMSTFIHLIWECSMVNLLWQSVLKFLEVWIGISLPLSPRLCLMGDKTEIPKLTKSVHSVLMVGTPSAARIILRHWKASTTPTFNEWKALMSETASCEIMLARVRGRGRVALGSWKYFMDYLTSK